jgi:glutathione S-transferase
MEYLTVAQAREMGGLRLVLSTGSPGPWGISARALFDVRGVPFTPVRQEIMQPNEELVAWTGRRNAPVAVYEDEPAVDNWLDIAMLAERLGTGPSLFPDDPIDRALAVGFSAEICGAGGFGWSRRLTMTAPDSLVPENQPSVHNQVMQGYGMRADALRQAPARIVGILNGLVKQLRRQSDARSDYLVGKRLGACDLHWACFSTLVAPLAPEHCAMPDYLRAMFTNVPDEIRNALDPILIGHRDRIWERHIGLPLEY